MVTSDQISEYDQKGFVVLRDVLSAAEIARIEADIESFLSQQYQGRGRHEYLEIERDAGGRETGTFRRINHPHRIFDSVAEFTRSQKIIDILTPILGPNIRLHNSKINLKLPGGAPVEWHQDWAFYPHTNDDFLTVGILLDDATEQNGGMLCIPGSHRGAVYDHRNSTTGNFCHAIESPESSFDLTSAEGLFAEKGSLTLHHVRTLHGSGPNHSNSARRFLLIGYAAADAWPLLGVPKYEEYESAIVSGESTVFPRMEALPLTVPFPVSRFGDQIFESQRELQMSHFLDN